MSTRTAGTMDPGTAFITDMDVHLFNEGSHLGLGGVLGAHPVRLDGVQGTRFAVWAPAAADVRMVGDFNGWDGARHAMHPLASSGIWQAFVPGIGHGERYKYRVHTPHGEVVDKADPVAFHAEDPPRTASVVWEIRHDWADADWMARRAEVQALDRPIAVYELHLGSWRRDDGRSPGYRELAEPLAEHVTRLGFTHVELLPVMEHPFYGSWGYQTTGYFAPTSRYGTPDDLMHMIDVLHGAGIGVIVDWVPSHFPDDPHALARFDGTHLYEHADPKEGRHMDWDSLVFNHGRHEVRGFLLSSAMWWLGRFHADGLRVDAVASMLYRDYSRREGEWIPNVHGGRENLEAVDFLRRLTTEVRDRVPGALTIAEESTAWPGVTRPVAAGGLGFDLKWDMGWMHDTLAYMGRDPIHRAHHHHELTFRGLYAFSERFMLPLSHDEVVHGKGSLLDRMPGDDWQRRANLRLLLGAQFTQPGKKLLFMGGELGQPAEWDHEGQVAWDLLGDDRHAGLMRYTADLAARYRQLRALHAGDTEPWGFEWVEADDAAESVLAFLRRGPDGELALVVQNFTPVPRLNRRFGVPHPGGWREVLNSDAAEYGGSGQGNQGWAETTPVPSHGHPQSLVLTAPPLAVVVMVPG